MKSSTHLRLSDKLKGEIYIFRLSLWSHANWGRTHFLVIFAGHSLLWSRYIRALKSWGSLLFEWWLPSSSLIPITRASADLDVSPLLWGKQKLKGNGYRMYYSFSGGEGSRTVLGKLGSRKTRWGSSPNLGWINMWSSAECLFLGFWHNRTCFEGIQWILMGSDYNSALIAFPY